MTGRAAFSRRGLLAGAGLALAGCSGVPTTGPVQQVSASGRAPVERGVVVHPVPPQPGASPELVVAGFIDAMAALEPGFGVARQFLTPRAARTWDPAAGVTVFDGDTRTTIATADSAALQSRVVGRIDERGSYTSVGWQLARHDFRIQDVSGQWRIDNPPRGLLVSQYALQHRFAPVVVWFLGAGGTVVVPERVWLASTELTPTQAVQALLRGPSEWLAPCVTTAFPGGTRLQGQAVSVTDGIAEVALDAGVASLPEPRRRQLAAQLAWTLRGFDEVVGVRVKAGAQTLAVPGGFRDGEVDVDDVLDLGSVPLTGVQPPLALQRGHLGTLSDAGVLSPLGPARQPRWPRAARRVVRDAQNGQVWLSGERGWWRWAAGRGSATVHDDRLAVVDLCRVAGMLWLASGDDGERALHVAQGEQDATALRVPALAGTRVVSLALSPDRAMLAVVLQRGRLRELGLLRWHGGHLGGHRRIPLQVGQQSVTSLLDVAWSGPGRLLVLGATPASPHASVFAVSADGAEVQELGPGGETELVALASQPQLEGVHALVRTAGGRLLRYEAPWQWRDLGSSGIQDVSFPG